jgi:dinuclear metal center YbgI/SA1388 family protein
MADRDDIIAFCDDLLDARGFDDYGPNGLQIPGQATVEKVVSGVSAHRELLERAVAAEAQLALTHHGVFWDAQPRALSPQAAARLRVALQGELSLAAYHLPLDAHPEIGNNALLCERLGFEPRGGFGEVRGRSIGVIGEDRAGLGIEELTRRVAELTGREPLVFDSGPELLRTIGFVSGAGTSALDEAVALGLDAFLTGEPAERAMADAREGRLHYIAAGHYATETLGIRRLGELVAERFGVEHEFVDVPNPV